MHENSILKNRTGHPVFKILERVEDFDKVGVMKFYNNLETLLKRDIPYSQVGEKLKICLVINTEETDGIWNLFDKDDLVSRLKNNEFQKSNIMTLGCSGQVIKLEKRQIKNPIEAEELSSGLENQIIIFIDCRKLDFFVNGRWIHHIEDIIDALHPGQITKDCLPVREYRNLIENHYRNKVEAERGFKYWKNKKKRILFDHPEITFHKPLYSYLDDYVLDGKVDSEISLRGTPDRTDIRILTFNTRELYIIEIKCLGKSGSNPRGVSDDWANKGILQIKIYLEEEQNSNVGVLVLYDGREDDKDIRWVDKRNWHDKTDPNPMRFYLISESASERAKLELKRIRNESRCKKRM
jgi:hypothetical protein